MTGTRSKKIDIAVLLVAIAIVFTTVGGPLFSGGGKLPSSGATGGLNAAATIKVKAKNKSYTANNAYHGIDVSKWNGSINWAKVAGDDVSFALIRSNYGTDADPNFVSNAKAAHQNGILVGAYHYARFKTRSEMQKEARAFIAQLKKVDITYPVALDLEHTSHGLSKTNLTALALEFMQLVEAEGYTVMLYTYQNYIPKYLDLTKLSGYNLWLANYLELPTYSHKIWQYSSTSKISGISGNVDRNVAFDDLATNKGRRVDKAISTSVQNLLNERYGSSLDPNNFDFAKVTRELDSAFQEEVNRQLGGDYYVDGNLDSSVATALSSVNFVPNETQGRITCLIQGKLFYKGLYTQKITGVYDNHTIAAVKAFQRSNKLDETGDMDLATWAALLGVKAEAPAAGEPDDDSVDTLDSDDDGYRDNEDFEDGEEPDSLEL